MAFGRYTCMVTATLIMAFASHSATAQTAADAADMSPTLLIETGPSDNPSYRRMVFVKYLADDAVTVSYVAYNRTEFIQVPNDTPDALIAACLNGPAATLEQVEAYRGREAERREANTPPAIEHFCIKDISAWDAGNKATYLDPIFDGLPHAAALNN